MRTSIRLSNGTTVSCALGAACWPSLSRSALATTSGSMPLHIGPRRLAFNRDLEASLLHSDIASMNA
jgi:hypothetical protein